jgi:IS1 family transposase
MTIMLVRGIGIRDIRTVLGISVAKVLKVIRSDTYPIKPKQTRYDCLETDEFWAYVGQSAAYLRASPGKRGNRGVYVGEAGHENANKLRERMQRLGISCDRVAADDWDSFVSAFGEGGHETGKKRTVGIERINCRLRHRIRRLFCRTCRFSKSLLNHWKAFDMAFFYIN